MILRPYVNNIKTAFCMSGRDRAEMKFNTYSTLNIIYQRMGWVRPCSEMIDNFKDDEFINWYYNGGKPYVNVLLDYYYTVYLYWLKSGGHPHDYCRGFENIYQEHVGECTDGDCWKREYGIVHRMFLLKRDWFWYKRFFRKRYVYRLENYRLFENGKPRNLSENELIKFKEYLEIDKYK